MLLTRLLLSVPQINGGTKWRVSVQRHFGKLAAFFALHWLAVLSRRSTPFVRCHPTVSCY